MPWINACSANGIGPEEVIRFDHGARAFVIVRGPADKYCCTDGLCTQ